MPPSYAHANQEALNRFLLVGLRSTRMVVLPRLERGFRESESRVLTGYTIGPVESQVFGVLRATPAIL